MFFPWDAKENIKKILSKRESRINVDAAKLVKAGLSKQLVEEVLKKEARNC